jgi:hypothetical protein
MRKGRGISTRLRPGQDQEDPPAELNAPDLGAHVLDDRLEGIVLHLADAGYQLKDLGLLLHRLLELQLIHLTHVRDRFGEGEGLKDLDLLGLGPGETPLQVAGEESAQVATRSEITGECDIVLN